MSGIRRIVAIILSSMAMVMVATSPVLAAVPDAPGTPAATVAGPTSVDLTWTAAAANGTPVTGYTVTSSPDGLTATTAGPLTATVTGLTPGTAYTFTVVAESADGPSSASSASNSVTPDAVPGAPTAPTAAVAGTTATITWTAPANTGSAITGYTVTSNTGGFSATTTGALTASVTGLTPGSSYTFSVVATNDAGDSSASAESNSVTATAAPGAPGKPTVAIASSTSIDLTWAAAEANGSAITGYVVTASNGGGTMSAGTATSLEFTGLTPGDAYTFTVVASNANGPGSPSPASNSITPAGVPGASGTPVATVASTTSAGVSWTAAASNGAAVSYLVTASPGGATKTTSGLSTTFTGLTTGATYTFTVRPSNVIGNGPLSSPSNDVTLSAVPGAPGKPTVSVASSTSVALTWTAAAANGSAITGYTVTASGGGGTATTTGALSLTFPGLTTGTAYTFTVTATNADGTGAASTASNSVTPAGVPGTPGVATVVVASSTSLTPSWTAAADNGASVSYLVTIQPGGGTQTTSNLTATFTGLTTGQPYTFTVRASNVIGNGGTSAASTAVAPAGVPAKPATPTVSFDSDVSLNSIKVDWTAPGDNGSAITGYEIIVNPGNVTVSAAAGATTVQVSPLNPGTYTAKVRAINALGDGTLSDASSSVVVPDVPGLVTNIRATSDTLFGNNVRISWDPPTDDGGSEVLSYTVKMAGLEATIDVSPTFDNSVEIGPLPAGFFAAELSANTVAGPGPTVLSNQIEVRTFAPFNTKEAYVTQQYLDFLGRAPDAGGLAFWTNQTTSDKGNVSSIIVQFMRSPEFAPRRPVTRLYLAYFKRNPEPGGFDYWTQLLASGQISLESISQEFAKSEEFVNTYGALSNEDFVNLVYTNVLKRPGEVDGVAYWLGQLNAGLGRGNLMTLFSESAENVNTTSAEVDVIVTYRGMLNRIPEEEGKAYWMGQIAGNPNAILSLVGGIYIGEEYGVRVTP